MEKQTGLTRAARAKARTAMVEQYVRSGKSQRQFCEDEGVSLSTLQWWMKKTRGAEPEAIALREMEWPGLALEPGWRLELESPRGWKLRHREPLGAVELARLMKSLKC